jgi:hypothetical protein
LDLPYGIWKNVALFQLDLQQLMRRGVPMTLSFEVYPRPVLTQYLLSSIYSQGLTWRMTFLPEARVLQHRGVLVKDDDSNIMLLDLTLDYRATYLHEKVECLKAQHANLIEECPAIEQRCIDLEPK